ncbi:MAG: alpha/beta fold hydrolase [Xanthobacteraceae bacterium]|nr:MAG: alpha/beta fold hydrolase [Xanthobacteraceae bacterium]
MIDALRAYDLLIHPGLGNSGVDHWQSHWCMAFPNATRVIQDEWDDPRRADWLARLDAAVAIGTRPAVLICHSLACALAAHWAARGKTGRVRAIMLVAPADVDSPLHTPDCVRDFAPLPLVPLPVPSLVVASSNDGYIALARARELAALWGADFCDGGELGHINSESRLGLWPQGLVLLGQLVARIENPAT